VLDPWYLSGGGRESKVPVHLLNEFLYFVRRFQSISTKHQDFIFTVNVGMLHSVIIYLLLM